MPVESSTEARSALEFPGRPLAPDAGAFAAHPATWYLFGPSRELRDRPVSKTLLGRRLVAFRDGSGRAAVLGAHCSHQGADLGRGSVVGDAIQCPYHHWRYDAQGRCVAAPGACALPEFAGQPAYPAVERHGYVYFFNGRVALFPLPFFVGERPEEFVAGRSFSFVEDCPWWMLVANGFDVAHFRAVHDRTMIGAERVDSPAPFARRIRFDARVTGDSVYDRLLRGVVGGHVEISITSWGGPFVTVTGTFRRAKSYILITPRPLEGGGTLTHVTVCAPRGLPILRPLGLRMRRLFTRGFMRDDIARLTGVRYNPRTFVDGDRVVVDFLHWLAALPQATTKEDAP